MSYGALLLVLLVLLVVLGLALVLVLLSGTLLLPQSLTSARNSKRGTKSRLSHSLAS